MKTLLEELLQDIIENAQQIQSDATIVLQSIPKEIPINLAAFREGDKVKVVWNGQIDDIMFSIDGGKTHSIADMIEKGYNPPPIEGNEYYLGRADNVNQHWTITAFNKDGQETVTLEPIEEEGSEVEIKPMIWGWWYDEGGEDRKYANTIKCYANDIQKALDTQYKVVPFIGDGSLNSDSPISDWEKRFRYKGEPLKNVSREKVPVVILADEPDHYPVEFLEKLIDLAKRVINPNLSYTFSFRRTHILPNKSPLPQNADVIWINLYLQRGKDYTSPYPYVQTEQDFYNAFESTMDLARTLASPNTKFYITTQTFSQKAKDFDQHGYKFRKPDPRSPMWYAKFISQNDDILGALHFVYNSTNNWDGADSMPELLENVKNVYNQIST